MKLNIQWFATWDDVLEAYNNEVNNAQTQKDNLATEKETTLNDYNDNYNNQLDQYEDLMGQQQDLIDIYKEEQTEAQKKQTEYNLGIINQNKEEAAKDTSKNITGAYVDYMKATNRYGSNNEQLSRTGEIGSGYSETVQGMMFNTYQNRVSTAKEALTKANTQYDNQIQQALLTNDANLAQIALEAMQQSYNLALQGFEYKSNLYNDKLTFEQNIKDSYFNREQTLQNRIDNYQNSINAVKQYQEEYAMKKEEIERQRLQQEEENKQWWANYNTQKEQWKANFEESQRQYNQNAKYVYNDTQVDNPENKNYQVNTQYYQGDYNKDALTNGKFDKNKVFSNGYQPNNYNGNPLSKTGKTVKQMLGADNYGYTGASLDNQNVWTAKGRYYVWDGSQNIYVDITSELNVKQGGGSGAGGGGGAGGFR